jgi:hypothetical protein
MQDSALDAILECGRRYRDELLLPRYVPNELVGDWRLAFDFFLDRACYQGRSDNVSEKVCVAAKAVLKSSLYAAPDWSDPGFADFRSLLEERVGSGAGKPGKGRDVEMILSALRFVREFDDHNLIVYSLARIRTGELASHYDEIQAARGPHGITQVGPKIAAFYLRDLASLFELDDVVPARELALLQPVDVWVRRLASRLGLADEKASDEKIRNAIVDLCTKNSSSTLLFNQGLWYLRAHAFDLLLERMGVPGQPA